MKNQLGIFLLVLYVSIGSLYAANPPQKGNPEELLARMQKKFKKINNYRVDATITVDVSFINIPERKATIYFKQPGKMHVETNGFTLLPRQGINNAGMKVLDSAHTALITGAKEIRGHATKILKVIPKNSNGKIVLTQFWIAPESAVPLRVKTFTKNAGSFTVDFHYANHPYNLPDKVVVSFSMKEKRFPAAFTGNFENFGKKLKSSEKAEGRVIVAYSNYRVNQGLPDSIFNK